VLKSMIYGAVIFAATICTAAAQTGGDVTGRWLTENGKGVIVIAPCGDALCGSLDWMKPPADAKPGAIPRDKHNPDPARRQQPMCGLQIIYGFHRDGGDPKRWVEGHIYDPESGDTYHANITLEDANHLRLRGYVGIPLLGESQRWTRADRNQARCHAG
jgi:uncharacterized protein (DUF2147 family)